MMHFMVQDKKRKIKEEETLKPSLGLSITVVRDFVYTVTLQNNYNLRVLGTVSK